MIVAVAVETMVVMVVVVMVAVGMIVGAIPLSQSLISLMLNFTFLGIVRILVFLLIGLSHFRITFSLQLGGAIVA